MTDPMKTKITVGETNYGFTDDDLNNMTLAELEMFINNMIDTSMSYKDTNGTKYTENDKVSGFSGYSDSNWGWKFIYNEYYKYVGSINGHTVNVNYNGFYKYDIQSVNNIILKINSGVTVISGGTTFNDTYLPYIVHYYHVFSRLSENLGTFTQIKNSIDDYNANCLNRNVSGPEYAFIFGTDDIGTGPSVVEQVSTILQKCDCTEINLIHLTESVGKKIYSDEKFKMDEWYMLYTQNLIKKTFYEQLKTNIMPDFSELRNIFDSEALYNTSVKLCEKIWLRSIYEELIAYPTLYRSIIPKLLELYYPLKTKAKQIASSIQGNESFGHKIQILHNIMTQEHDNAAVKAKALERLLGNRI